MRNEPEAAGHFQCGRSPNEELRAVPGPRVPALLDVLLGWRPSLHPLRCLGRLSRGFVRRLHRYYCAIRLPTAVHAGRAAFAFSGRTAAFACSQPWGLPVLVHTISRRARGLRLRGSAVRLAISAVTACCLPLQTTGSATSVCGFRSSIPCPSLPLSMLRTAPRDARRKTRGQDGFAAPFLSDSFIPYCMPVYPDARSVPPVSTSSPKVYTLTVCRLSAGYQP